MKDKVIVILGPTGVGKTKLSVELAHALNGEVINADSTQIYKDLDIATAKVTDAEKEGIKHHLFDIKNITENYTVYDYQIDCRKIIDKVLKAGNTPIIVGGTGLYIKAALYDYKFSKEQSIENEYLDIETKALYTILKNIDPNTNIHENNRKRIIRAINYYNNTNTPFSEKSVSEKLLYNALFIGLTTDRDILYDRINKRVDIMVENGLIDEARKVYSTNIRSKAVMTPIGYKELFKYFDSKISISEAIDLIKQNSRHYAKRQYTWFKNKMHVNWFDVDFNDFNNTIKEIIKYINSK